MGLIPTTIKQENKIIFGLSFQKILAIMTGMAVGSILAPYFTTTKLMIPFIIFVVVVVMLLSGKDYINPRRSKLKGLMIIAKFYAGQKIYHSIQTIRFNEYMETQLATSKGDIDENEREDR